VACTTQEQVRVRDMVWLRDRDKFRVMNSIGAAKYGWFATHFDDLQMQTVNERQRE